MAPGVDLPRALAPEEFPARNFTLTPAVVLDAGLSLKKLHSEAKAKIMRVGISILTHNGHNVWNNGIAQNVYLLAKCIDSIPFVEKVFIIDCGDQNAPPEAAGQMGASYQIISLQEAHNLVDVAIEMSGALGRSWKGSFREKGGRIAFHNCGQPYSALIEPSIFGKPGCFVEPGYCDEVWLLPKDNRFTAMQRAIYRCPVYEVPYLWAADFLQSSASGLTEASFGYNLGSLADGNVRPAIFEPNISPIKMGIIPLFICEEIERRQPERLASVKLLNAAHMLEALSFSRMIDNLALRKSGKLEIGAREYFAEVMGNGANVVVSHQMNVSQNYLYLDALYGNYPLLHNSEQFSDVGYFYRDSSVDEAATLLQWVLDNHDSEATSYNAKARAKLASFDPIAKSNKDAYARRLLNLCGLISLQSNTLGAQY